MRFKKAFCFVKIFHMTWQNDGKYSLTLVKKFKAQNIDD